MRTATLLFATVATLAARPAIAQTAQPPIAEADSGDAAADGDIIVFGRGETRNVQTINASTIEMLAPGTSPLRAIQRLPGVNFQSADPFGSYEWSQRVSIRSFNQNQLGLTFDGIPLGDGS